MINKIINSIKWRLGYPVTAELLQLGTDESVIKFYNTRVTDCQFVTDPKHYEFPRFKWINSIIHGGKLLEIGCGNGGMTEFFSTKVDCLVAMDVSKESLVQLDSKKLSNVKTVESLIEDYVSNEKFDWIIMSEVIEHLRNPENAILKLYHLLAPNGKFLITTPNGFWESNEHLQEFTSDSLFGVINKVKPDKIEISYIKDFNNQRRWLNAILFKSDTEHLKDDFYDRKKVIANRKIKLNKK